MGLTTALYTGRTGLNAHSQMLAVTGNNIANVNTTAFKGSRAEFETLISQTLSSGSPPTGNQGGSNPAQIGLGVQLTNSRDFTNGALQPTGSSTDMAVEGNGFFVVNSGGEQYYTRAGNFTIDRDRNLVNASGALVQGYGVDNDGNIIEGQLDNINIPVGIMTVAEATQNAMVYGKLKSDGDVATDGAIINTQPLYVDPLVPTFADDTTALDAILDADGNQLFNDGDLIQFSGAKKGNSTVPPRTFEVGNAGQHNADTSGLSLGDLMNFFNDALGINDGLSGGVSIDDGVLAIEGNVGTQNDLDFEPASFLVNPGTAGVSSPLSFNKAQAANGESVRTNLTVYDSLGSAIRIDVTMVLEGRSNAGQQWRYYAESSDHTQPNRQIGTGVLSLDNDGQLLDATDTNILIERDNTGAVTPQQIQLQFDELTLGNSFEKSELTAQKLDGSYPAVLSDFVLSNDGTIRGIFGNSGVERVLGQLPLAQFVNQGGLEAVGGNLYKATPSSGEANFVTAGTGGAGITRNGHLEGSNIDLANEFINLISATTGFSASSRVLTTSDRLLQELMTIVR